MREDLSFQKGVCTKEAYECIPGPTVGVVNGHPLTSKGLSTEAP